MKYLEAIPERCSGELTIKGTRIRVAQAITLLANGYTIEQLHDEWWPHVPASMIRGAVEEATQYLIKSANV
jgi:uncharacterized protein (DUF433 family)